MKSRHVFYGVLPRTLSALALVMLMGAGCTESSSDYDPEQGGDWIDEDATLGDVSGATDTAETDDTAPNPGLPDASGTDTDSSPDIPTPDTISPDGGVADVSSPDVSSPDVSSPDATDSADTNGDDTDAADVSSPPDVVGEDEPCEVNSECATGLVCCNQGLGTANAHVCVPESDCRFGGYCDDESDCGAGTECCDFNFFGGKMCAERCFGGDGGNPGPNSCETDADCPADAAQCCDGFGGMFKSCRDSCDSGPGDMPDMNNCEDDADCSNPDDICCKLGSLSICLSSDIGSSFCGG